MGTAARVLLGAAGGLASAVAVTGSGLLLAVPLLSGPSALALAGGVTGMAVIVVSAGVTLRFARWCVLPLAGVQLALMMTAAVLLSDAVLDQRGEQVTAVIERVRARESVNTGQTSAVCDVRLPDGSTAELDGDGCRHAGPGARLEVYQDPEGLVPPRHRTRITARQYAAALAAGAGAVTALGAWTGARAGSGARQQEEAHGGQRARDGQAGTAG